jgi:hypothetical protein
VAIKMGVADSVTICQRTGFMDIDPPHKFAIGCAFDYHRQMAVSSYG